MSLPTADDLFRPTAEPEPGQTGKLAAAPDPVDQIEEPKPARRASGRVRHDEKMTVYVTAEELLDIEQARLHLRRDHGLAVDRGRLVRAAIAQALAELDEHGADAAVVRRLEVS